MTRRLAVLHHDRSFFPLDLRAAIGDDISVLWVLPGQGDASPSGRRLLARLGAVVDLAGLDLDAAARVLSAHDPEGIVTFVDDNLELAAGLAHRLGLAFHTPEVAANLANKARQRRALAAHGVPGPRFWSIAPDATPDALTAIAAEVAYPAVLKPANGSGSRGILALSGPDDLVARHSPGQEQLVEEYLRDDPACDPRFASYLSIESVVSRGRISHVTSSGRFALAEPFRETGNFIPAAIDPPQRASLGALTDAAIAALGITTGVLHTEIKLTAEGPKLIEVNGRLGGRPPFVLQSVSDVNLFRVACEVALDLPVSLPAFVACRGVGYWRMLQPPIEARRVREVHGLEAIAEAAHVDSTRLSRHPGDAVDWREGTDGQVLTVRGRVENLDALAAAIAFIDATGQVVYDTAARD